MVGFGFDFIYNMFEFVVFIDNKGSVDNIYEFFIYEFF